jgi:hypothetical protein
MCAPNIRRYEIAHCDTLDTLETARKRGQGAAPGFGGLSARTAAQRTAGELCDLALNGGTTTPVLRSRPYKM